MTRNLHVVMVPWSAFGHLIPFFQLSIGLAKAGIKVSFISTHKIIERLPQIPPNLATLLEFVALPLPALDDKSLLPEDAEVTVDIPSGRKQYLKIAYDLLQNPVKQFISDQRPDVDWIISDIFPYWVAEIAQENQIPIVYFSIFPASTNAFFLQKSYNQTLERTVLPSLESLTKPLPELGKFSSSVAYQNIEAASRCKTHYENDVSGISDIERCARVIHASKALAIRTCPEYEADYLNKCKEITGKPVFPTGLLLPEKPQAGRRRIVDKSWVENFEWLDGQKPNSVVFVGFGSEYQLSKEQIQQVAYGLELSGLPFLWALRKPYWTTNDLDVLPPGFIDRTRGRGLVCMDWAPQLEILGHPSIGGMLSHGGWGSIIETLQFGHSLVVLPFVADQPLNARLLVDKGMAAEVERNNDESFNADGIAKALKLVMVSKEGENIRVRAKEAVQVCGNQNLQDIYFDRFVEYLKKNGAPATGPSQ